MSTNKTPDTPKVPTFDVTQDFPLSSPAQKAYNDRVDQIAAGKTAMPEPTDAHLLRDGLDGVTHVATQQPEEFAKTGGQTIADDNSNIQPEKESPKKK